MVVSGIIGSIFVQGYTIPELTLENLHPDKAAIWPLMFVTVACTYILQAPEGFKLSTTIAYPVGIIFAILCFTLFMKTTYKEKENENVIEA